MPIYDYKCRACEEQFELLVRGAIVPECPSCRSLDLEQLLSTGFAVSSESISKANLQTARKRFKTSNDYREHKVAEMEELKEHEPQLFEKPKKK